MPIIRGLPNVETRAVNTVMSRAFFPRAQQWLYPELAGSTTSVSKVEPFAILGSVPPLQQYKGLLKSAGLPDWGMNVPNLLFKNAVQIGQSKYEFDQTGTVVQLSQGLGMRLAQFPDQLWATRVLQGSDPDYDTVVFEGQEYSLTFDGVPFFSENHDNGYSTQSNIIEGGLPSTKASLLASDWATNAKLMQQDLQEAMDRIKTVVDNQGIPLFPTIDMANSIVVVVPPILEPIASLAFRSNTAPGTNVIDQTTNVAPLFVRKVLSSGYLEGIINVDDGTRITPPNETDWYIFIVDDFVKPFYMQFFRPMRREERFPPGQNVDPVDAIVQSGEGVTVEQATVFASTRVDTTFQKIGANADAWTIENEAFVMSARTRGNMVYGPWFTGWRIIPSGGTPWTGSSSSSSSSSSG